MYIDTHSHIFDTVFDEDRAEAIARAMVSGVERIILPAIDSESHDRLIDTALKFPINTFATIGLHPTSVNDNPNFKNELDIIEGLLQKSPVKFYAIGEIGLDLYWSRDFLSQQQEALIAQTEIAIRYNLPIILHVRDAWSEIFDTLAPYRGRIRGVFHSFSGSIDDYRRTQQLGDFMVGIGGVSTYKKSELPAVIVEIPIDRIVLETDSPYLPPVPHRGKRNESSYIPLIASKIAEVKSMNINDIEGVTSANAVKMFFTE